MGSLRSCPAPAFFLLLSASLSFLCDGGKVLVYPIDGSHWVNMKVLVEVLHSRGHQITVIRSSTSWYISESSPHYASITVPQEHSGNIESQSFMTSFLQRSIESRRSRASLWALLGFYRNIFDMVWESQQVVANMVISILENRTLMKELREAAYDLCLTDPAFPGGVLLGNYLRLPMVYNVRWILNGEAHFAIAPSPLSFIPQLYTYNTDEMDFFQRIDNIFRHSMLLYMLHAVASPPYQALCEHYFGPGVSVMSLTQGADLWLMRVDFTFEFPRPTMPNVIYVGGFQAKPAGPLSPDLEEFVHSSGDHGMVVMSLGTLLGDPGPEISEILASAFASLPQKVVWRHTGERPRALGNNTMLVKWMPQNDLLGHPKAKVFVTHGGTNGIYEAIYHGVPVLGIPLIFDQHDNMVRMKARGVAEVVEVTTMDVESLTGALKNILDPQKPYKQNMLKLSRLHRDTPIKPIDSAIFWIEYVMRHKGAAHLRSESYKLPWYVYYCVDVVAAFAAFALLVVLLAWFGCKRLIGRLMRTKTSTSKSKND